MKGLALSGIVFVLMAAGAHAQDLAKALSGKTLVGGNTEIRVNPDGTLAGKAGQDGLQGTWKVDKGKWCRTITAPKRLAGSACQTAVLKGKTLSVQRADGSTAVLEVK